MSAEALAHVFSISGVSADERLCLIWLANMGGGLGYPVSPEWIGMGEFMCCHYEHAFNVLHGLAEKGFVRLGSEDDETAHCVWLTYGGEFFRPIDWTGEIKSRNRRVIALIERDGPECVYCRCTPVNYEVDHFIPRSKGGADRMSNLVLACPPCNRLKRDMMPQDFLRDDPIRFRDLRDSLEVLYI